MRVSAWLAALTATLGISLAGLPGRAATSQDIDRAIDKAKAYLYSKQKNGNWEIIATPHVITANNSNDLDAGDWGGLTAIAVHALLAAGENPNEPRLSPAIQLLLKSAGRGCAYAVCQRDQVLELLPRLAEVRTAASRDGASLQQYRVVGEAAGLYHYPGTAPERYDHSVSQFGVLGMWACSEVGFEVPLKYWQVVERAWQRHQDVNGGWSYTRGIGSKDEQAMTVSMTAAGVATLFITQDYVHSNEGLDPAGNIKNPFIEKGMAWLSKNFDSFAGARDNTQTYALYGLERIGVAGGYKYFGRHDWYAEGADWLIKHQAPDGSIGGGLFGRNHDNVPSTAFAMFFLTRGREPVAINKLQYDIYEAKTRSEGHWNQRPRDVAKITRWIEKQAERNLNWHIVSLKDTPVDELQDAPLLYISGDHKLDLAPEDEAKLKEFVEDGGLIVGNPDGTSKLFIDSFLKLAAKLFPAYEPRPVPEDGVLLAREQFHGSDIRGKLPLMGVSNGVRELMVVPRTDFAKAWQADLFTTTDAFRVAFDIYQYAAGRTSFRRGDTTIVRPNGAATNRAVKLARLDYSGNADPEPGGWRRLAAIAHNGDKIDLQIQTVKLGENHLVHASGALPPRPSAETLRQSATKRITADQFQATGGDPAKLQALVQAKVQEIEAELAAAEAKALAAQAAFKLAHMTGTTKFTLTAAQRQELKAFAQGGGLVLIDAAGGAPAFAQSAEMELAEIFGSDASQLDQPIPASDALYQGGAEIPWAFRIYALKREGGFKNSGPHLRGIKLNGRWAVLWSREDISNALVGRDVDGVIGYTPESAVALVRHVVRKFGG